jgi:hypothetical protein
MQSIASLAARIEPGSPVGTDRLCMVPLTRAVPSHLRYDTLQAALGAGTLQITEVGVEGRVPEVRVVNEGKLPVLILEGAALVGAKQNRVLNLTVLVPAHAETLVPVSCVEQGRWHATAREFSEGEAMHFPSARASKVRDVSRSLAMTGLRRSDQGKVWAKMASYSLSLDADAPTGAMQDIYRAAEGPVEEVLRAIAPVEGQVGAAFVSRGRLLGLDAFDAAATFKAEFPKIARSYAVDAVRSPARAENGENALVQARAIAADLLAELASGEWSSYPGVGLGTDFRLTTSRLAAGALVHEDEIAHLAAFPGEAEEVRMHDSHAPAMPRRRYG